MKSTKLSYGLMLLAGLLISGVALADRGHVGVGFYFGGPFPGYYPPAYYPYPYYPPYYPPAVMTVPAQPQVYIEQASPEPQQAPAPQASSYWYHCSNPEGYYPYIKECPEGWQKVVPTPPPQK
ncbi:hypothetical protein GALL_311780 [mine drainage metagenome]|uniref:Proline-rich region n=1 Tax=mine drainage metagenome TaxID=410659 RepID=A0A1J5R4J1_9ZZZZ